MGNRAGGHTLDGGNHFADGMALASREVEGATGAALLQIRFNAILTGFFLALELLVVRVLARRVPRTWGSEYHLYRDSMNPVMTAGAQIAEAWRVHRGGSRKLADRAARQQGLGLHPIHPYYREPPPRLGLLLGFAGLFPRQIEAATKILGDCLRALP